MLISEPVMEIEITLVPTSHAHSTESQHLVYVAPGLSGEKHWASIKKEKEEQIQYT